jgi:uncharacterized protein YhbP (UPF0306 family)
MPAALTPQEHNTVRAFLAAQSTLALATVNADGTPQIAPLFYVSDDALNLYWLSSPRSRHSVNVSQRACAAATIYPSIWAWQEIQGLQIEGRTEAISDDVVRQQMLGRYQDKFRLPSSFEAQIAASTLYRLVPGWLRWLDNGVAFGYKAEVNWNN